MKAGDRITVLSGQFAGRAGTVMFTAGESEILDNYLGLKPGEVRVALDGERGETNAEAAHDSPPRTVAHGGRGGVPINIAISNLAHDSGGAT